jgi:hypothetical protein
MIIEYIKVFDSDFESEKGKLKIPQIMNKPSEDDYE